MLLRLSDEEPRVGDPLVLTVHIALEADAILFCNNRPVVKLPVGRNAKGTVESSKASGRLSNDSCANGCGFGAHHDVFASVKRYSCSTSGILYPDLANKYVSVMTKNNP